MIFSWIYLTVNLSLQSIQVPPLKQTFQLVQQIIAKNVHPVSGAGIQTHDLLNINH